jgi:hypothetical protein
MGKSSGSKAVMNKLLRAADKVPAEYRNLQLPSRPWEEIEKEHKRRESEEGAVIFMIILVFIIMFLLWIGGGIR